MTDFPISDEGLTAARDAWLQWHSGKLTVDEALTGAIRAFLTIRRERAAMCFAERVRRVDGVEDVRLIATSPELEVAVLLATANLELELELRGCFVDIMRRELDVTEGELFVYTADEEIPPHVLASWGGPTLRTWHDDTQQRTPDDRWERKADATYLAKLVEDEPWPVIFDKVAAWLKLRRG